MRSGPRRQWVQLPRFGQGVRWQRQPSVAQQDVQAASGEQIAKFKWFEWTLNVANDSHLRYQEHVPLFYRPILLLRSELACVNCL